MKLFFQKTFLTLILIFLISVITSFSAHESHAKISDATTIKIATWNLWDFAGATSGSWKTVSSNCESNFVCRGYADVITSGNYDMVFVQEIKGNFVSFSRLCDYLNSNYHCKKTQNMGTTSSGGNQEGYGVIYKKNLGLEVFSEYTGDNVVIPHFTQGKSSTQMARPSMKFTVTLASGYQFIVFNNHIRTGKSNVSRELKILEDGLNSHKEVLGPNIIILGDLNADGGSATDYGHGSCNNYYYSFYAPPNYAVYEDATYDDSDTDGDDVVPEADASDYYVPGNPNNSATNFNNDSDDSRYKWGWVIENRFNMVLNNKPQGTSQGTNFPNAVSEKGNRGCVYDRIIASDTLFDYKYSGQKGAVGTIPYNIDNVPSPRGQNNDVTETTIVAGTPFKNKIWWGNKGSDVYGLSDHKIVWARFNFAAISPTNGGVEKFIFKPRQTVYFQGEKFNIGQAYKAYVHEYVSGGVEDLDTGYLWDGEVHSEENGSIDHVNLGGYNIGQYEITVDVDGNGRYDKNIDIRELFTVTKEGSGNDNGGVYMSAEVESTEEPPLKRARTRSMKQGSSVTFAGSALSAGLIGIESAMSVQNYNTGKIVTIHGNVKVGDDGNFQYLWSGGLEEGAYNAVIHPYKEGPVKYNPKYDIINFTDQIGFIVTTQESKEGFNNLVTLNSTGYDTEKIEINETAKNLYILSKNLPASRYVDVYVVRKLDKTKTWQEIKNLGNVELSSIAVPMTKDDADHNKTTIQVKTVDNKGEIFSSIAQNLSSFIDEDYINKWDKRLNIIVDVNRDGIFNSNDMIDTHNIDVILANIDNVSASATATSQYQELLNAKLDLKEDLVIDGVYGSKTQDASLQYICSRNITSKDENKLRTDAEIGFRLLLEKEYVGDNCISDTICNFQDAAYNNTIIDNETNYCITAKGSTVIENNITVAVGGHLSHVGRDFKVSKGVSIIINADGNVNPLQLYIRK